MALAVVSWLAIAREDEEEDRGALIERGVEGLGIGCAVLTDGEGVYEIVGLSM